MPHTGPDGKPIFDLAGAVVADEDTPVPPRLLGMWDNALLAHSDRGRLIPAEYRTTVIRRNGDVLPMLLVDGYVAGVWRPVERGIEATAFRRLSAAVWESLAAEAENLTAMLADREPRRVRPVRPLVEDDRRRPGEGAVTNGAALRWMKERP